MTRIFAHYISLRAVMFAAFELCGFIFIYELSRVAVLYLASPGALGIYGHMYMLPACSLIAFCTAAACGLYNKEMASDPNSIVSRVLTVSVLMYFLMAVTISLGEIAFSNTQQFKLYYAITLLASAGYFVVALLFRHAIFTFDFNNTSLERRVLVVGADDCAAKIEDLHNASRSPYKAVGFIPVGGEEPSQKIAISKILSAEIFKCPTELARHALQMGADEIVVASKSREGLPIDALLECKLSGISVTEFASFWERQTGQIDLQELSPSWLIFSGGFRLSWMLTFIKRAFDISIALMILILTLPITVLAAIATKCDSRGPLFYRQERVGFNGVIFSILKFRTMRVDAEKDGVARWAQPNDARITRVGAFLRRTRIDEIPQVLNVLKGNMSIIGPRPERLVFVEMLREKIPHYDVRQRIKPGITGWAQINYPYGASDEDAKAKLAYDLYYTKNWSVFLDIVILFQTASVVLWPMPTAAAIASKLSQVSLMSSSRGKRVALSVQ